MWLRGDFLVPYINGEPYSHKPPLLFWLIHLGWALFGVNDWWPRLVAPLCALAAVPLMLRLGALLWPEDREARLLAVGCCRHAAVCRLHHARHVGPAADAVRDGRNDRGFEFKPSKKNSWIVVAGCRDRPRRARQGAGDPASRAARRGRRALVGAGAERPAGPLVPLSDLLLGVLLGAAVALAWARARGLAGGETYRQAIFWGQTAGRVSESFAHRRGLVVLPAAAAADSVSLVRVAARSGSDKEIFSEGTE